MLMTPSRLVSALLLTAAAAAQGPAGTAPVPTFTEHVAPIVFGTCSHCHRPGEVAPFPLLGYADVKKRGKNLLAAVEDRFMPPWHPAPGYGEFRHDARLTDAQIQTIRAWVDGGMPEGPPERLPKLPDFKVGWQLGEPDLVVAMSEPFDVPASGRDVYREFSIPLGLDHDVHLTAIEVRPSARSVLHHTLILLDEHGEGRAACAGAGGGRGGLPGMRFRRAPMIAGWAIGGMPERLPDGLALKIPANSDLVLQSHFHPSGKKEKERTTLGLYFAARPPERTLVAIQLPPLFGALADIDIPPGAKDHRVADSLELPCAVDAVTVGGHAHLLCTSLRMRAMDGDREIPLLRIDDWDFDWQNRYTFRDLVPIPKGAVLEAELHYDNSADNPHNPNRPPKRVKWGRETTDEMGSVTLLVVPHDEKDLPLLQQAVAAKNAEQAVARVQDAIDARFAEMDGNGDGKLQKREVPARLRGFFDRLDKDGDGALSKDEAKAVAALLEGLGRGVGGGR